MLSKRTLLVATAAAALLASGVTAALMLSGAVSKPPCPGNSCHTTSTVPPPAPPPPPPPAWTTVVNTGFDTDGVLPAPWRAYDFANSTLSRGWYLPSHVVIAGGVLSLVQKYDPTGPARNAYYEADGGGWYQGAIIVGGHNISGAADSIDHRTTFRARVLSAGAVSHRNIPLWWPRNSDSPNTMGEEDWMENDGGLLTTAGNFVMFLHYGSSGGRVDIPYPGFDVTAWHTYVQTRLAHRVTVTIDGVVFIDRQLTATELQDTIKVPVFQQENTSTGPPPGTTGEEDIQLDYVTIEVPA